MLRLRALIVCAVLFQLLLGCSQNPGPAPVLSGVAPSRGPSTAPMDIRVNGENFSRRLRVDFSKPSDSRADGDFHLELVRNGVRTELGAITFVDQTQLQATVPAGLEMGTYSLELTDPWNRTTSGLSYEVADFSCPGGCDDGLDCTEDRCDAGICQHPVAAGRCLIDGVCRAADEVNPANECQACNPGASQTAWSPFKQGQTCNDHDACTLNEHCLDGACTAPTTVKCSSTTCTTYVCDPQSGACIPGTFKDGEPCDDGSGCTTGDVCSNGACHGTPTGACGNNPPTACLTAKPSSGPVGTLITLDATCSQDTEDPTSSLAVRFDVDGSGTYVSSGSQVINHVYNAEGYYAATVEVKDTGGKVAYATRVVAVSNTSADVAVTTLADENDPSANPAEPGGSGLSLREAIAYANASGTAKIIRLNGRMRIHTGPLPPLTAPGAVIVADPEVTLDFTPAAPLSGGASCLVLAGANQRLIGVHATGCPGPTVETQGAGAQLIDCQLSGGSSTGVLLGGDGSVLGPRTEVFDFAGTGVLLKASNTTIDSARISRNGAGVDYANASLSNVVIQRSEIVNNRGAGISVSPSPTTLTVRFNTVDGNGGDGLSPGKSTSGITAQNNLFTRNGGAGMCGAAGAYTRRDPNGAFGNDGGTFCDDTPDSGVIVADPHYLAPAGGDFRLMAAPPASPGAGSPMIDVGVDLGLDVNGPAPGNFNGTKPDLGAHEAP